MVKKPQKIKSVKRIFQFIAETGMLMQMPRSHKQQLGNTFDTVSSHSHHTALIAYCLARMEKLSHEEGLKAMAMGVFHDTPEARTGDLNFVEKHYASVDEDQALEDQLKKLPFADDLKKLYKEYAERETPVAKCAKDADSLEQMYQTWVLTHVGNKLAERWFKDAYRDRVPYLRTKSAKRLAQAMKNNHPQFWWYEDLVNKGMDVEKMNRRK